MALHGEWDRGCSTSESTGGDGEDDRIIAASTGRAVAAGVWVVAGANRGNSADQRRIDCRATGTSDGPSIVG